MPLFGKTGAKARDFIGSPMGQQVTAAVSRLIPGDPYAYYQMDQRRAAQAETERAQREQFGTALSDLMAQMRGPDTMTPQVNELIGGANMRGGQVGMAPMPMQTPRRAGLDYSDPATREAFQRFIMAGGKPEFAQGIAESMQPPKMQTFNTRSGVVGVNPETGEVQELYQDPYAEALAQKQIDATDALAEQRRSGGRAALINANRPRGPAPVAGAAGAPADQPWLQFRR
jgi:hypothetical protein